MIALAGQRRRVWRVRLVRFFLELLHPELKCERKAHVTREYERRSYRAAPATTIYAAYRVLTLTRECRRCGSVMMTHETLRGLPSWPTEALKQLVAEKGEVFV